MTTSVSENYEQIKELVCEILELEEDEVTAEGHFKDEYGADSLRAIEILAALEKEFKVVIDQSELSRMFNLSGVVEVVEEAIEKK